MAFATSLGSLVLPLAMSVVFDITGSWNLTWAVPAVIAIIGAVIALLSKK